MDEVFILGHMGQALGSPQGDDLLQQSLERWRALIQLDPTRPDFRRELGNAAQRVGRARFDEANGDKNRLEEAAELFDEAMTDPPGVWSKQDPGNDVYESNLSLELRRSGAGRRSARAIRRRRARPARPSSNERPRSPDKDADNAQWRDFLASHFELMIEVLQDECQKGCDPSRNAAMVSEIRLDFVREIWLRQDVAVTPGRGRFRAEVRWSRRVRDFLGYMKSLDSPSWTDEEVKAALATCRFPGHRALAPTICTIYFLRAAPAPSPPAGRLFALAQLDIAAVDAVPRARRGRRRRSRVSRT